MGLPTLAAMNLLFLIPVVLLVLIVLFIFYRRKGPAGSGLGDRRDDTEPWELRGTEQSKHRPEFGGDPNRRGPT